MNFSTLAIDPVDQAYHLAEQLDQKMAKLKQTAEATMTLADDIAADGPDWRSEAERVLLAFLSRAVKLRYCIERGVANPVNVDGCWHAFRSAHMINRKDYRVYFNAVLVPGRRRKPIDYRILCQKRVIRWAVGLSERVYDGDNE